MANMKNMHWWFLEHEVDYCISWRHYQDVKCISDNIKSNFGLGCPACQVGWIISIKVWWWSSRGFVGRFLIYPYFIQKLLMKAGWEGLQGFLWWVLSAEYEKFHLGLLTQQWLSNRIMNGCQDRPPSVKHHLWGAINFGLLTKYVRIRIFLKLNYQQGQQ